MAGLSSSPDTTSKRVLSSIEVTGVPLIGVINERHLSRRIHRRRSWFAWLRTFPACRVSVSPGRKERERERERERLDSIKFPEFNTLAKKMEARYSSYRILEAKIITTLIRKCRRFFTYIRNENLKIIKQRSFILCNKDCKKWLHIKYKQIIFDELMNLKKSKFKKEIE